MVQSPRHKKKRNGGHTNCLNVQTARSRPIKAPDTNKEKIKARLELLNFRLEALQRNSISLALAATTGSARPVALSNLIDPGFGSEGREKRKITFIHQGRGKH
jgi:hypothetical protein